MFEMKFFDVKISSLAVNYVALLICPDTYISALFFVILPAVYLVIDAILYIQPYAEMKQTSLKSI